MEQWKKLQEMRKASGIPVSEPDKSTVEEPEGTEAKKLVGEERARDAEEKFVKKEEPPAAPVSATAEPTPEPEPAASPAPVAKPTYAEIDIDGVKVSVDPSLAAAFGKAEKIKQDVAKVNDREALKAEIAAALKAELNPPKSEAEIAAEQAIKAAEEAAKLPKEPDSKLLIENPEEWRLQQKLFDEARTNVAVAKAKAEVLATIQEQQKKDVVAAETNARNVLREQFFRAYPVLRDSADLVQPLLEAKFNEVVASGKLAKPLTEAEREDLKEKEFADVAAKATRRIVTLMKAGKNVAPPAPPPNLAASAPVKSANPEAKPAEPEKKAKYPAGSVSALLAARKASRDANAA